MVVGTVLESVTLVTEGVSTAPEVERDPGSVADGPNVLEASLWLISMAPKVNSALEVERGASVETIVLVAAPCRIVWVTVIVLGGAQESCLRHSQDMVFVCRCSYQ